MPRGQKKDSKWLSIYLEAPEAKCIPDQMAPRANFTLKMVTWDDSDGMADVQKGGTPSLFGTRLVLGIFVVFHCTMENSGPMHSSTRPHRCLPHIPAGYARLGLWTVPGGQWVSPIIHGCDHPTLRLQRYGCMDLNISLICIGSESSL